MLDDTSKKPLIICVLVINAISVVLIIVITIFNIGY